MKTTTTIAALLLTAGTAFAQADGAVTEATGEAIATSENTTLYDYDTMVGYNEGLTQEEFDTYDVDRDGLLDVDEQTQFMDAGYANDTPVEELAEPTDGIATGD